MVPWRVDWIIFLEEVFDEYSCLNYVKGKINSKGNYVAEMS